MKCDRCKEWHQRTVIFENDIVPNHEPIEEHLCLTCLANLMFGRVSFADEKEKLKRTLKGVLEDASPVPNKLSEHGK